MRTIVRNCPLQNNASNVASSRTTMCTTGPVDSCAKDMFSFCGYPMTMQDGFTYYVNCPTGYHCTDNICQNDDPALAQWRYQLAAHPIVTRCNAVGLYVENGKCQDPAGCPAAYAKLYGCSQPCPANLQCIDTVV